MIIVRDVFQAKYGRGGELVALMKEASQLLRANVASHRILTDASGPFYTVVTETEVGRLADWEKLAASIFSNPEFGQWFGQMVSLVESGRREFYNVE